MVKFENPLGQAIFDRSYALKDANGKVIETFEQACRRIAKFAGFTQKQVALFEKLLLEQKIVPGGRWWYGSGRSYPQISNCFVLPSNPTQLGKFCQDLCVTLMTGGGVGSNYSDIPSPQPIKTFKLPFYPELYISKKHKDCSALVTKFPHLVKENPIEEGDELTVGDVVKDNREGWGRALKHVADSMLECEPLALNLSTIRPRGTPLKGMGGFAGGPELLVSMIDGIVNVILRAFTGKHTLGPIDWMKIANFIGRYVSQSGSRRSAQMAMLHWQHSSIEKFIKCKDQDGELEGMNISVVIDNLFVKQAGKRGTKAHKLFNLVMDHACIHGEPGFWNQEEARKDVPAAKCVNPCLTGDTWINTSEGAKQITDLLTDGFKAVVNGKEFLASMFWETGIKPVYAVQTTRGYSLTATEDHKIKVLENNTEIWKEVKELKKGDAVVLNNLQNLPIKEHRDLDFDKGWILGGIIGSGAHNPDRFYTYVKFRGSNSHYLLDQANRITRQLVKEANYFSTVQKKARVGTKKGSLKVASQALTLLANKYIAVKTKEFLPSLEKESLSFIRGVIGGFFDAEGRVYGTPQKGVAIRLSKSGEKKLKVVQRMLLRLGIASSIYFRRKGDFRKFLELNISGQNLLRFNALIGFVDPIKQTRLNTSLKSYHRKLNKESFVSEVFSVNYMGIEKVYDCTVKDIHTFEANGILTHNCGEIGMPVYSCCNLGHINLAAHKSLDEIKETSKIVTELLINGTIKSKLPLTEMYSQREKDRRIGVGILGLHTWLVRRGKPFFIDDTDECFFSELYSIIRQHATLYAKKLKIKPPEACTTIAPTGSISFLCGVTSGIEPMFCAAYKRRYYEGGKTSNLVEKVMIDPLAKECLDRDITVQDAFSLSVEEHLDVQIKMQRSFVDHSVSKTLNLPTVGTFNVAKVKRAVLAALKQKVRGITVYPNGARGNQPIEPVSLETALKSQEKPEQTETKCASGTCEI